MQCKEMEDENFAVQLDPSALSELNKYCEQNYHEIQVGGLTLTFSF